jgi:hypothetical protein
MEKYDVASFIPAIAAVFNDKWRNSELVPMTEIV